jgi:hypothetical protein
MQLTRETFVEILETLRSNCPSATDHRRQPRVGVTRQVEIILPGRTDPIIARIRDISQGGVGILSHLEMSRGTEFIVTLYGHDGSPHFLQCRVCHARRVATGLFQIGACFQKPDAETLAAVKKIKSGAAAGK